MSDNPEDPIEIEKEDHQDIVSKTVESHETSAKSPTKRKADDESSEEERTFKRLRKEPLPDTAVYDWTLPSEMALYAHKYFERYVQEKDMRDSVIGENPVPTNFIKTRRLDEHFKELLDEKRKRRELDTDKSLEHIQSKVLQIMGPLSKLWFCLEEAFQSEETSLNLEELLDYIDSTILLVGQSYNMVSYKRRLNVLIGVGTERHKAKAAIKDQAALLEQPGKDLFGEPFRKHVNETAKAKKKSKEIYQQGKREGERPSEDKNKRPFRSGPSFKIHNGGQDSTRRFDWKRSNQQGGKTFGNKRTPFQFGKSFKREAEGSFLLCGAHNQHDFEHSNTSSNGKVNKSTSIGFKAFPRKRVGKVSSCRKIKIFSSKLEKNHKQPRDFALGIRFRDRISRKTISAKASSPGKNVQGGKSLDKSGSECHVGERSNPKSQTIKGPISEQSVLSSKEGWGQQTCDKLEKSKCLYSLPPLQNGGFTFAKRYVEREGLDDQNRSKRRLFLRPPSPKTTEIHTFSVGRAAVRVFVPMLRAQSSPSDFYKVTENSHSTFEKDKRQDNYIPGRHVTVLTNLRGLVHGQGYPDLSFSASGVCNQPKKISVDPHSIDRIPGAFDRFSVNDTNFARGKGTESDTEVPEDNFKSTHYCWGNSQSIRVSLLNSTSSFASFPPCQISTTTTYSGHESRPTPASYNALKSRLDTGVRMVGKEFRTVQWKINSDIGDKDCNSDRCLQEGLGSVLSRQVCGRPVDLSGGQSSHKCVRVESNNASSVDLFEDFQIEESTFPGGQYDCSSLPSKNGRDKEQRNDNFVEGDMGICPKQKHDNNSRISTWKTECEGRLGIKELSGLKRVAIGPSCISEDLPEPRPSNNRPFCFKSLPPATTVHVMASGSRMPSSGCLSTELAEERANLCISPFFPNREISKESTVRGCHSNLSNPKLASSIVVRPNFGNMCSKSNIIATKSRSSLQPTGTVSPIDRKSNPGSSGLENFRQNLFAEGISTRAAELIIKARRGGTTSNYKSAWGKWFCWCSERQVDPFLCDLKYILDFLAFLHEQKYEYSTINTHRSAISAYHDKINDISVGKHPKVCALMTGIFNENPPKPKYVFIWDVEKVLNYLRTLQSNAELSDRDLVLKVTILLFLASTKRGHEICYLDVNYMIRASSSYKFYFTKVTKSWKKGQAPPTLELKQFAPNNMMCVVSCLDVYLERSKSWRSDNQTQLLLSHLRPHNEVKTSTIANWVKLVLQRAGIDVKVFQAHSCRSASTSKAKVLGLSLEDILKRGQWTQSSTWQKFYNKDIDCDQSQFESTLLNSKKLSFEPRKKEVWFRIL